VLLSETSGGEEKKEREMGLSGQAGCSMGGWSSGRGEEEAQLHQPPHMERRKGSREWWSGEFG
jgi:hypothetical protein